jgi:hypothetical protein
MYVVYVIFQMGKRIIVTKSSPADLLRMEQLLASGIPLDEGVVSDLRASCQGLSLYQTGAVVENELFDLAFGGFGLLISVSVGNDSPGTIHISQYRLEPPWPESDFRWLEDPRKKVPRERNYSFPQYGPEGLERECVLNHRVDRQGRLLPGECIEGFLCGVGQVCIPHEYQHRQRLSLRLSVFDGRGRLSSIINNVIVNRRIKSDFSIQRFHLPAPPCARGAS